MKINHFSASKVHGYLDFDIKFFPDLTFLTGINGSGKTTAVNSISALISPSLATLAHTEYETMRIEIEHENDVMSVAAHKESDSLVLESSATGESLRVPILREESLGGSEKELEYFREQEARYSGHPVVKLLRSLPTPMFLGLERRSQELFHSTDSYYAHTIRRRTRNVFSSSLSRSLVEATFLAEQRFNAVQAQQRELTDRLRKQIILAALKYESTDRMDRRPVPMRLENLPGIKATLKELGLSEQEVSRQLDPFVERLRDISRYLPFKESIDDVIASEDKEKTHAYMEWLVNRPQFERLLAILKSVERYIADGQTASRPLDDYLAIVNNFLNDSHKELSFDRTGNLRVSIRGGTPEPITALSSGESQLVVILTHLAFNPAARAANVFIVDEPELSLHLKWQELFVDAVRTINPEMQAILATHSPAIILDDIQHCVDLTEMNQTRVLVG